MYSMTYECIWMVQLNLYIELVSLQQKTSHPTLDRYRTINVSAGNLAELNEQWKPLS